MAARTPSTRAIAKVFFTVVGLAALLYLAWRVRAVLGLLGIAVFLAVAMGPAVDVFSRRGVPRWLAILLVYVELLLAIFVVGLLVVPPVVSEVQQLARDAPEYVQELRQSSALREYDDKYRITEKLQEQARQLPSRLADAAGALRAVTVGVFSALVQLVTVLTLTFFLLLDGGRIVRFGLAQMRRDRRDRYAAVGAELYRATGGYVGGALTIGLVAGATTYLVLLLLGVPFAVPLAVLQAFMVLIPLVGATLGGAVIAIVTLFQDFPTDTVVWVVFLLVYQQVENNVLQPLVYRRAVNLHPVVVIVGILVGASLLGVLGALLAIPVTAAAQILVKDWWTHRPGRLDQGPEPGTAASLERAELGQRAPAAPAPAPPAP